MIGQLRQRAGLYGAQDDVDEHDGVTTSWPFVKVLWCDMRALPSAGLYESGQAAVKIQYRAVIRFQHDFPARARLIWNERTLRVVAASDPDGRQERLHLICEEELS